MHHASVYGLLGVIVLIYHLSDFHSLHLILNSFFNLNVALTFSNGCLSNFRNGSKCKWKIPFRRFSMTLSVGLRQWPTWMWSGSMWWKNSSTQSRLEVQRLLMFCFYLCSTTAEHRTKYCQQVLITRCSSISNSVLTGNLYSTYKHLSTPLPT